jgi:hypothetical protein
MYNHQEKVMKATLNQVDLGLYEEVDKLTSFEKMSKAVKVDNRNKMTSKKTNHRIDKRSLYSDNW